MSLFGDASPMPVTPCFAVPFRVGPDGEFAVVEQDSTADIASCIAVLLATERGSRLELPDYGITDPSFTVHFDDVEMVSQARRYEPRAQLGISTAPDFRDALAVQVNALVAKADTTP